MLDTAGYDAAFIMHHAAIDKIFDDWLRRYGTSQLWNLPFITREAPGLYGSVYWWALYYYCPRPATSFSRMAKRQSPNPDFQQPLSGSPAQSPVPEDKDGEGSNTTPPGPFNKDAGYLAEGEKDFEIQPDTGKYKDSITIPIVDPEDLAKFMNMDSSKVMEMLRDLTEYLIDYAKENGFKIIDFEEKSFDGSEMEESSASRLGFLI